ncbi:MAG: hypothetical protein CMH13_24315 [Martelella sp.]|uniref:DUF2339 domain-containing protein n=1 Tax=Martelella sp. TaxID=1969699 RepID=UPI000C4EA918|nr:DUF2339 domain-containing protein [Martelella sp.]MAU23629.1 hypothetical protein [Martelella sp.]
MTSVFWLLVILLVAFAMSHSRVRSRLRKLEDEQQRTRQRLELLERQAQGNAEESVAAGADGTEKTPTGEPVESVEPPAVETVAPPEGAPPAEAEKSSSAVKGPPRAFVFTGEVMRQFTQWLRQNWTIALAALSLALGGVFMVQYGVENGLLTPVWRVVGALALGALMIAVGEAIRRRYGDERTASTAALPSVFAGAGLVTLFSAVLAARLLYGLVSPETTLAGLVLVSILAVALGWLYGSVLSAVGIIGATAAPFLVGGESESGWLFFYYFAFIAIAGLAVDSVKRWAWVSAVVLIATSSAATLLYVATGGLIHYTAFLALSWLASVIIPVQSFVPTHAGQTVLATLAGLRPRADFPTRVVAAMTLFVSAAGIYLSLEAPSATEATVAFLLVAVVLGATLIWMHRAEALKDVPLLPAAAFLAVLVLQAVEYGPLFGQILAMREAATTPATFFITLALVLSAVASIMAFWRMTRSADDARAALGFTLGAATFAPASAFIFQFLWSPAAAFGDYLWSLHILAIAAVMAVLTDRTLRSGDANQRQLRAALFAIAALSMLALALFVVLTQTALTLALGVVVILTIWLDRRFDLALIGIFTKVALAIIAFRLIASPGFFWAVRSTTPWLAFIEAYGGTLALLYVGWRLTVSRARQSVQAAIETATWTIAAVFACALLQRLVPDEPGLLAAVMAIAMVAQINRLPTTGKWLRIFRAALAVLFGLVATALIAVPLTITNPVLFRLNPVTGPAIFDSLALSYLPLAAVLAIGAWKIGTLGRRLRIAFTCVSSLLAGFYVACEIRRFWRGNDLSVPGVTQPELYSYTIALVIICAVLLLISFSRRSHALRKVAMAATGLTIAKVFLVDISGLEGLLRVVSFIGLGLALAGLGWLDRAMNQRWNRMSDKAETTGDGRDF